MANQDFHRLTERIWWLAPSATTDRPTLGVIVGDQRSLVVDTGNSPAHVDVLLAELRRHDVPAPHFAALTHWHWDHVFGSAALAVPTFASRETQRVVQIMAQLDWSDAALDARVADGREHDFCRTMIQAELPDRSALVIRPPEIAFERLLTLELGGVTCRLIHVGGDHSPDGIVVHLPQERVAFIGDALYVDFYHGPLRRTTTHLFPLLDQLLALDVAYYVSGHDPEPITRTQLEQQAATFRTIGDLVNRLGPNREAVLTALPTAIGAQPDDDHIEIANALLVGLQLPEVVSPL